jgi:hypothetical protein
MCWVIFPLMGLAILAGYYVKQHKTSYIACWMAISAIIFIVAVFRKGTGANYGIETTYAVCLCGGLYLEKILRAKWDMFLPYAIVIVFILLVVSPIPLPDASYPARCQQVLNIIKDGTNPVVTENAGLILLSGKTPYNEPFVFTNLKLAGIWDDSQYIKDLQSGYIQYLVLNEPLIDQVANNRFTAQQINIMEQNYHIVYNTYTSQNNPSVNFQFTVYIHN